MTADTPRGGSARVTGRLAVYVCHPVTSYGEPGTARAIATLTRILPGAILVNPEDRGWKDSSEWLEEWPGLLVALAGLVVVADRLDTVGTGCLREVTDAITLGLPVAALVPGGRVLRELRGVERSSPARGVLHGQRSRSTASRYETSQEPPDSETLRAPSPAGCYLEGDNR